VVSNDLDGVGTVCRLGFDGLDYLGVFVDQDATVFWEDQLGAVVGFFGQSHGWSLRAGGSGASTGARTEVGEQLATVVVDVLDIGNEQVGPQLSCVRFDTSHVLPGRARRRVGVPDDEHGLVGCMARDGHGVRIQRVPIRADVGA